MKRQFLGVQEGVWAWQQLRRRRVSRLPRGSGSTEPRGVPLGAGPDSPEGQAPPCPGVCPWGQVLTPQRARLHLGVPLGRSPDSLTLQPALPPLLLLLRTTVARTPGAFLSTYCVPSPEHLLCAEPWSLALLGWSQWSHSTNMGNETVPSPQITRRRILC